MTLFMYSFRQLSVTSQVLQQEALAQQAAGIVLDPA